MSVVIVFGVCGCGKTTVGRMLADKLQCQFADADQWHPRSNVDKMSRGIPLTDLERQPWLKSLHDLISGWRDDQVSLTSDKGGVVGVLACSALKKSYRDLLRGESQANAAMDKHCVFVLLRASEHELRRRVGSREGHFMPTSLIQSQLSTLEYPDKEEEQTVTIETDGCGVDDIVMKIIDTLRHMDITT